MQDNFFLADLLGVGLGFSCFVLFLPAPGYVAAWLGDLFGFRARDLWWRAVIALPVGVATTPTLYHLSGRVAGMRGVWALIVLSWLGLLVTVQRDRRNPSWRARVRPGRHRIYFLGLAAIWVAITTLSLVDLQSGDSLYFPVPAYDFSLRAAFTASITQTGIPPQNPLFYPGQPQPLRYHYAWLILCSLADQAGGDLADARQALLAGNLWCVLALLCMIPLYVCVFGPGPPEQARRWSLLGVCLLGVTGLDIVPVLWLASRGTVTAEIEWWNEQVSAWVTAMLWVPHHLAGALAALVFVLLLREGLRGPFRWQRAAAAALALASTFLLSVFVALAFFAFLGAWGALSLWKRWTPDLKMLAASGVGAAIAVLPYVAELGGSKAGGKLLALGVRNFYPAARWGHEIGISQGWVFELIHLAALPLNYGLELGFFFAVALLRWRQGWPRLGGERRNDMLLGTLFLACLVFCTFVRSVVIPFNDLGARGFLLPQFVLLLWALEPFADVVRGQAGTWTAAIGSRFWRGLAQHALPVFVLLGFAGTAFEITLLRSYPVLAERGILPGQPWMPPREQLGRRTSQVRSMYAQLRRTMPERAIVQHNPESDFSYFYVGLYGQRPALAESKSCGAIFGGDAADCPAVLEPLERLFHGSAGTLQEACGRLGMTGVMARDTDPAWKDKESWVWRERPAMANDFARVYLCGGSSEAGGADRKGR